MPVHVVSLCTATWTFLLKRQDSSDEQRYLLYSGQVVALLGTQEISLH